MNSKHMKTLAFGATALVAAAGLSVPAHAGYDRATGAATGSYSSNTGSGAVAYRTITVTGTLVDDADDKNFQIRDAAGRTWNIETSMYAAAESANKLVAGDTVRVNGLWQGDLLKATNIRYLGKGYIASGRTVYYSNYRYRLGDRASVVGTLTTDADDDEFRIRASNGREYMIRTRTISDSFGLNKLVKGDAVRVYGYWFVADDQPQLEATNVAVLRHQG